MVSPTSSVLRSRTSPKQKLSSPDRYISLASRSNYFRTSESAMIPELRPRQQDSQNAPLRISNFKESVADVLGYGGNAKRVLRYNASLTKERTTQPDAESDSRTCACILEIEPYKTFDAMSVSDDFYTSCLAWSPGNQLAVALGIDVHFWYDQCVQKYIPGLIMDSTTGQRISRANVTALAYSDSNNYFALARQNGQVEIYARSSNIKYARIKFSGDISCIRFRPEYRAGTAVGIKNIMVGDNVGNIHLLALWETETLLGRIVECQELNVTQAGHAEQITGLAWSHDACYIATGGNDNYACVFEVQDSIATYPMFRFRHEAAIKALAFCPWIPYLLATGGGSEDQTIRFFDIRTGQLLKSLHVKAQVTSFVWSVDYYEFVVTFGYSSSEMSAKIKVFSWPALKCLVAMSLPSSHLGETRAIYAVNSLSRSEDGVPRGGEDLIVACSDETIRFYKLFSIARAQEYPGIGLGGGRVLMNKDLSLVMDRL